jgi:hypothetical protein
MHELVGGQKIAKDERQSFYSELMFHAKDRGYNPKWASHKYRERFGIWPNGLSEAPTPVSVKTARWIRHKTIAFAKSNQFVRRDK